MALDMDPNYALHAKVREHSKMLEDHARMMAEHSKRMMAMEKKMMPMKKEGMGNGETESCD